MMDNVEFRVCSLVLSYYHETSEEVIMPSVKNDHLYITMHT